MDHGDQLACFGGRLLTFRAFVPRPPEGVGWAVAWSISPGWLDDNSGSMAMLAVGPTHDDGPDDVITAWVPPALGRCFLNEGRTCPFRWFVGRWTTVSAHFDGPVARTCRFTDHPQEPGFTKRDAVASCRAKLIILSIGSGALPATDTATVRPDGRRSPSTPNEWIVTAALLSLLIAWRRRPRRA